MIAVVSRLAAHKGLDIVAECIYDIVLHHDVQLVILGMGEKRYESFFTDLERSFPDKVRALITYDRDLSKRIYAATDIFLMPSKSEPCGLSQMIASRYGAIPVVRETGGLFDSIKPYWEKGKTIYGNGFTFASYSAWDMLCALRNALNCYADKPAWKKLVRRVMLTDFSWDISAAKYADLYRSI